MQVQAHVVDVQPITAGPTNGPWDVTYDGKGSNQANSYPVVHIPTPKRRLSDHAQRGGRARTAIRRWRGPIWIKTNGKPGSAAVDNHFSNITISNNGKTLTITDTKDDTSNEKPIKFFYQLNFKGGNQNHKKLDPIIINDGGKGRNGWSANQIAEAVVGALSSFFSPRSLIVRCSRGRWAVRTISASDYSARPRQIARGRLRHSIFRVVQDTNAFVPIAASAELTIERRLKCQLLKTVVVVASHRISMIRAARKRQLMHRAPAARSRSRHPLFRPSTLT